VRCLLRVSNPPPYPSVPSSALLVISHNDDPTYSFEIPTSMTQAIGKVLTKDEALDFLAPVSFTAHRHF
jgi:hypothetical protein